MSEPCVCVHPDMRAKPRRQRKRREHEYVGLPPADQEALEQRLQALEEKAQRREELFRARQSSPWPEARRPIPEDHVDVEPQHAKPLDLAPLLTMREVCKLLGCHRRSIERWLREGRFPEPLRLSSRMLRWRQADVAAFLANEAERQRRQFAGALARLEGAATP